MLILFISGPVVYVMDVADRVIYKVCPFVAGGIFIGSVYWTAVTYGAVTVMQVSANSRIKAHIIALASRASWHHLDTQTLKNHPSGHPKYIFF